MGIDKTIYHNGKCICNLGRSYYYNDLSDESDITLFKMFLASSMLWPESMADRLDRVMDFNEHIDDFIEEIKRIGAAGVIDTMVEDGLVIVDE